MAVIPVVALRPESYTYPTQLNYPSYCHPSRLQCPTFLSVSTFLFVVFLIFLQERKYITDIEVIRSRISYAMFKNAFKKINLMF